jgi:hypothetical protein
MPRSALTIAHRFGAMICGARRPAIADVGGEAERLAGELGGRRLGGSAVEVDDHELGAPRRERLRGREPDAARTAGDQRHFSANLERRHPAIQPDRRCAPALMRPDTPGTRTLRARWRRG